ncbi:hypothetical protein AQUCO_04200037v1 [Aquilegia coerulea]|uniref:Cytochrome P450 n=1 Tax=Aquilegia coerulea TaxID=218851 RepID=A0A2G5CNX4_AQUCA|nr:hypothetical protein AQUCO_04200037v1 [Aquilegia coerulea]
MDTFFILAFLVLFVIIMFKQIFYQNSTDKPSIPYPLPILGHLHRIIKKPLHRTLAKLSDKYGPILFLRYGFRRVLLISSPSAVEECLTKNDIAFANRPHLIVGEHLGYNCTSLAFASYGDHWRNLRRITALEVLSSFRLQLFSSVRTEEVRSLVLQLFGNSDYQNFRKVEFKTMFFELTLNVLMRMIAGKRYYGENLMGHLDEAKRFQAIVTESFNLIGMPNLADFLPFLRRFDIQGLEKRMVKSGKDRDSFMQKLIDEHRENKHTTTNDNVQEKKTMIHVLLLQQKTDPEYYTDEIIKGIITALLTAGTDTSSLTMAWTFSLLLNHPEFLKKARDEIDVQVGQERFLEESDLPKLPYLNNIINETLRLYPTVPINFHESSKDCTVGGFHVPSNTMLLMNLWAVHRNPNVWVEPTIFNPERFEGIEKEKDGFKFMPFGSGRRRCPGEGLATRMVGLTLGSLIQCFEWKRVGEEMVNMREGTGITLPRVNPLVAMCKPNPAMKHMITQI